MIHAEEKMNEVGILSSIHQICWEKGSDKP